MSVQNEPSDLSADAGPRLDDQLCFALYAATNAITRAYRPVLGALGLTYPQYLVLMVLWRDGATTIQTIANRLRLGSNAVTPLVDRLAAAGLVARSRGSADRRTVHAVLTPAGDALRVAAAAAQETIVCRTGLSIAALDALRRELLALTDRIGSAGGTSDTDT